MWRVLRYAFSTGALAYILAAVLLFIYMMIHSGGKIDEEVITFFFDLYTLTPFLPHVSRWWTDFYYLRFLVPWLFSSLVLVLLLSVLNGEARRKWLLGGLSVCFYYFVMIMIYFVDKLVAWWGHIQPIDIFDILYYLMFFIWPLCGFGLGYLAATILERVWKPRIAGCC